MKLPKAAYLLLLLGFFAAGLPAAAQQFNEEAWGQNSPGVELKATETAREHTASGTQLTYILTGKGFPADQDYSFWGWIPGKSPQKAVNGVTFDSKGVLICNPKLPYCQTDRPDAPIQVKTTAVLGEPKRFAVVSDNGHVAGFAEVVPFPIEATDKKCKLEVIRQTALAEKVLLRATGFVPYEMLNVSANLGGEDTTHSPTTSADGSWEAIVGTQVPGKQAGKASVKVSGQQCSVALTFNWGEGSAKVQ